MLKLRAFTLIEVLITLTILSVSMLAIFKGNLFNLNSAKEASDLTTAVLAAESILKEEIVKGYPESGEVKGNFEEGLFDGFKWEKKIESLGLPLISELKLITIEVKWGEEKSYQLQTIISRY